jgi:hypothetical protein
VANSSNNIVLSVITEFTSEFRSVINGNTNESLQRELLEELYKPDVLDELLKESDYVVNGRKEVVSIQVLNKAEE